MRRTFLLLALLGCSVRVVADDAATFEQVTVSSTAIGISATTLKPTGGVAMQHCSAKLETADVRYRFDGTAPSATVGMLFETTDPPLDIPNAERAAAIQFIRTDTTDATLDVHCWR